MVDLRISIDTLRSRPFVAARKGVSKASMHAACRNWQLRPLSRFGPDEALGESGVISHEQQLLELAVFVSDIDRPAASLRPQSKAASLRTASNDINVSVMRRPRGADQAALACPGTGDQFQGSSSPTRLIGWSGQRDVEGGAERQSIAFGAIYGFSVSIDCFAAMRERPKTFLPACASAARASDRTAR